MDSSSAGTVSRLGPLKPYPIGPRPFQDRLFGDAAELLAAINVMKLVFLSAALLLLGSLSTASTAWAQKFMIELELSGRRIEGTPLVWSKSDVFLLARDGYLWNFHPSAAAKYRKTSDHFTSLSPGDMRGTLKAEFGRHFDVSGTAHYLVVHPTGQRDAWAPRFEELYRNYMRYFTARGFEPKRPQFPLIAVVFPNQRDFLKYANKTDANLLPGTLGFYSPVSNRILLYDVTAGDRENPNWQINAETIVHEAIHQMAFNTEVHSRYCLPPRWVAEGLGTMFEARGVWNSKQFTQQADRINRYRFEEFKKYATHRRKTGSLAEFVSSDRMFQSDPEGAYAEAWALTFYLFETHSKQYVNYLQATADRPQFTEYRSQERLAEFSQFFGSEMRQFESRYLKYVANLK